MLSNELIEKYLLNDDLSTYDPYDIWKTDIGIKVKQLYYKNKYLGLLPAGLLTIYDLYLNNSFRIGYKKQEYPIVRAQSALILLNLYKKESEKIYLEYAKKHIYWLIENVSKGYSGACWGLNFDWVYSANKIYDTNTPFSTHTPYPLEALVKYYEISKEEKIRATIESIYLFLENDLQIMQENSNKLIISYGAEKDRIVTNANSYIMYMYFLLLPFFPNQQDYIKSKIKRIYNFIIDVQNDDGSWLYEPYDKNSFIDCFHSAFVIKNILKINKILILERSEEVIQNGYNYIVKNFLDKNTSLFKRFSKNNKVSLTKFDLYDNAEMLNLAYLMQDKILFSLLENSISENFCLNKNIYSMIDNFRVRKNKNHLRWAIIPYIHALSAKEKICAK
jgi:hypothetical protein